MTQLIYQISIFGTFLVAGITLWHARDECAQRAFLGTSIVYGFLLEIAVIVLFGFHSYPAERFLFYLWAIPVFIPLAWGVIIYASFTTGRYLGLPRSPSSLRWTVRAPYRPGDRSDCDSRPALDLASVRYLVRGPYRQLRRLVQRRVPLHRILSLSRRCDRELRSRGIALSVHFDGSTTGDRRRLARIRVPSVEREALLFGAVVFISLLYLGGHGSTPASISGGSP